MAVIGKKRILNIMDIKVIGAEEDKKVISGMEDIICLFL